MVAKTLGQVISGLEGGKFANLGRVDPSGTLEARRLSTGAVMLYWRVTISSKTTRAVLGLYDSSASPKSLKPSPMGYSIAAARRAAEGLAAMHHANKAAGGYPALAAAEATAKLVAKATKMEAETHTVAALLSHYCGHIESLGRSAHKDARSIFKLHVLGPWPKLAAQPANALSPEQVADMMRRVLEMGKGRTANKLRSYISAAYQTARAARSKASVPVHFKPYAVTSNPAANTQPDEASNKPDKDPLSPVELRTYWRSIKTMRGFKGAVLRLHVLTGGQRIQQLVSLKSRDVTGSTITLFDGKGRPGKAPRPHTVPLIADAEKALTECRPQREYAISTDGGVSHLSATSLSRWAMEAAPHIPNFQTKRIRSGVETLLASLEVSSDHRGRLQSHGIAGVQNRHYDGHDYLTEKRRALEVLLRYLDGRESGKVAKPRAASC